MEEGETMTETGLTELSKRWPPEPDAPHLDDRIADLSDQEPVAHIRYDADGTRHIHPLSAHLKNTARRAAAFAEPFDSADWAALAGLWHDLGKYQPAFQRYIRAKADAEAINAHIEDLENSAPKRVDHSTPGAFYAAQSLGGAGRLLAYLIAGHHAGLTDWFSAEVGNRGLETRLQRAEEAELLKYLQQVTIPEPLLGRFAPQGQPPAEDRKDASKGLHLWLRMLYSCLVDADFLDTESFMQPHRPEQRGGFPGIDKLLLRFNRHMSSLVTGKCPTPVNQVRNQVYRRCCEMAEAKPGVFSLTVPTGGGKTLSSMAFALRHAQHHGKRRVIYVIPYTSIIEQTADVFREAFGDLAHAVVEHHSSAEADPSQEDRNTRLACENWDAPQIVTTSVQFLESLFAARSSRCRKLHNIVDSVVVMDEAQLIPPEFRQVILDTLHRLVRDYGVSLVICTATQPELGSVEGFQLKYQGLPEPAEIAPDPDHLHRNLKRVEVELPEDLSQAVEWEALAEELAEHESFLCIVNKRKDCRDLHALMAAQNTGGARHLSALMCGQHRADTIAAIKDDLAAGRPARVISTQLVEAGVDLDFPVVYRAMAGLDSIAQAAGRCNREGRLEGLGRVKVFVPPSKNFGLIQRAEEAAREMLHGHNGDVLHPRLFKDYFRLFYGRIPPDKADIQRLLTAEGAAIRFRTAADQFKLIDDGWQETIFVSYGEEGATRLDQLRRHGPERWLMRKLQRYAVSINKQDRERLQRDGFLEEPWPGIYLQIRPELYDDTLGVILAPQHSAEGFVC